MIGCIFIRDVTFFPDNLTLDPPPSFSSNVVQGKTYDMGDERYSRYFGDLMQMVLGVAAGPDLTQPWRDGGPVSATRGWCPAGSASRGSRPWSRTLTAGGARSPAPGSALS